MQIKLAGKRAQSISRGKSCLENHLTIAILTLPSFNFDFDIGLPRKTVNI